MSEKRDPASLDVSVNILGLDLKEAMALFVKVPAGRTVSFAVSQPAIGGPRYAASIHNVSTVQARDLLAAVVEHAEAVWNDDASAAPLRTGGVA